MSSRFRWLRIRVSQARSSSSLRALASESIGSAWLDLLEALERRRARPAASASRACAARGARPRSRAARRAARRSRRRRSRGRRGRSSGGCDASSSLPQLRGARLVGFGALLTRSERSPASISSKPPAAQPLEPAVVGEVEVDRGDRDPALRRPPRDRFPRRPRSRAASRRSRSGGGPSAVLARPASARRCRGVCRAWSPRSRSARQRGS